MSLLGTVGKVAPGEVQQVPEIAPLEGELAVHVGVAHAALIDECQRAIPHEQRESRDRIAQREHDTAIAGR